MYSGSTYLVAVAGVQAKRIVEAFYALTVAAPKPVKIERIDVIGTQRVWDAYRATLGPHASILSKVARQHGICVPELRFHLLTNPSGTEPLRDLLTTDDNMAAWRQVLEIVRTLIAESSTLLGVCAGARQALRQALTLAFQLLARPQDRLFDIRVRGLLAEARPTAGRARRSTPRVVLSELPFLRVQELPRRADALEQPTLVAAVQPGLDDHPQPSLEFHLDERGTLTRVVVDGRTLWPNRLRIRLRQRDLVLWLHLAQLRKQHCPAPSSVVTAPPCHRVADAQEIPKDAETAQWAPLPEAKGARSGLDPHTGAANGSPIRPCPCCFREAAQLSAFVPESDRELPDEYVRQAMSRIKRALSQFGLPLAHLEAVRFRGAGSRPHTSYGIHLDPDRITIRTPNP
ncbi:MAG: CRISPR-associated ring nuclease [Candidatus Binatia bacterium]|nr:CRISPR-associated ring nuclease [Candidatus Binatia bacterium]